MEIEYGAEVVDRNGVALGRVEHVMRNAWTGEISKFVVRRERPDPDLFLSQQDVLETTDSEIKVNVSGHEMGTESKE